MTTENSKEFHDQIQLKNLNEFLSWRVTQSYLIVACMGYLRWPMIVSSHHRHSLLRVLKVVSFRPISDIAWSNSQTYYALAWLIFVEILVVGQVFCLDLVRFGEWCLIFSHLVYRDFEFYWWTQLFLHDLDHRLGLGLNVRYFRVIELEDLVWNGC